MSKWATYSADDLAWMDNVSCAAMGPEDFFVEAGRTPDPEVIERCRACPVRVECLTFRYRRNFTAGYFAGLSPGRCASMSLEEALEFIANDPPHRGETVEAPSEEPT